MEDQKTIIYDFLAQFEDFTTEDKENGYANVYRPSWHPHPLQFWFNPPYDTKGISEPTISNTIVLTRDGKIMVQDVYTDLYFNLDDCLGGTIDNFLYAIKENHR